jgi:hypothetical protein
MDLPRPVGLNGLPLREGTLLTALVTYLDRPDGAYAALSSACAVVMRGHVEAAQCAAWSERIELGRADWTSAFSGARARITATVHAARLGSGLWEYWF